MDIRTPKACALLLSLLAGIAGCATTGVLEEAPAARQPVLRSIHAMAGRSCDWTAYEPDRAGKYALLPSSDPDGTIRVAFLAPYPSRIEVEIEGRFALPNIERRADRSRGFYRIDSIAKAGDSSLWKVSIAPPTAARLMRSFDVNIRNVSLNPDLRGLAKTSGPLTLVLTHGPVADLDGWLDQHPQVLEALSWNGVGYAHWSAADKQVFRDAFVLAWNGSSLPVFDQPSKQVLPPGHAKSIFIANAAAGLAAEIAGWTSWSVTAYSQEQLELLFDSRRMFRWNSRWSGFEVVHDTVAESVAPRSPQTTLEFIYGNGLFSCESRHAMIARTLDWARAEASAQQRTMGCSETVAFLHGVLRVANIPVKPDVPPVQGATPAFVTQERRGGKVAPEVQDPWQRLEPKIAGLDGCAGFTPR